MKKILLAVLAVILMVGCNGEKELKTINVGAILPLSGDLSYFGEMCKNGMDLALADLDNANIRIMYEDSQAKANIGLNAYNKLYYGKEDVSLYVTVSSQVALALSKLTEKNESVLFANVTHPHILNNTKNVLRISSTIVDDIKLLKEFILSMEKGCSKIVLLCQNDEYGHSFVESAERDSIICQQDCFFQLFESTDDFKQYVAQIRSVKPDMIYILGAGESQLRLINQIRGAGDNTPMLCSLGFPGKNAKSKLIKHDNIFFGEIDFYTNEESIFEYQQIANRYKEKYKGEMTTISWLFYNTIIFINNTYINGSRADNYVEKIKHMGIFNGAGGEFEVNSVGDILPQVHIVKL